jgi:hypothetical protein
MSCSRMLIYLDWVALKLVLDVLLKSFNLVIVAEGLMSTAADRPFCVWVAVFLLFVI